MADLAVLLNALGQCSRDPDLSDLDCERTTDALLRELSPFVWVSEDALESALAYANMQDELKRFVDFRGNTFDQLVSRIGRFNKAYNYFETEE